jgi:hypothetical protein
MGAWKATESDEKPSANTRMGEKRGMADPWIPVPPCKEHKEKSQGLSQSQDLNAPPGERSQAFRQATRAFSHDYGILGEDRGCRGLARDPRRAALAHRAMIGLLDGP